jgi:GNAT superfamily N-acetyltransferase
MTAGAIIIRAATPEDAESISALAAQLSAHEGDAVGLLTPEAVARDGFGEQPEISFLLAEIDREVVGYAGWSRAYSSEHAARGLYLADIFVAEHARRRGVGRALVTAVARLVVEQGLSFVWWASKPWNAEAHAFYASLGAVPEPIVAHLLTGEALARLATAAEPPFTSG